MGVGRREGWEASESRAKASSAWLRGRMDRQPWRQAEEGLPSTLPILPQDLSGCALASALHLGLPAAMPVSK